MLTDTQKIKLIKAGICAPSADNSQPWLYGWEGNDVLLLFLDESLSGEATDSTFVLSDLAVGAVIESIVLEAMTIGYHGEVELFPNGDGKPFDIAQIKFSQSNSGNDSELSLANCIPARCTDRRFPFTGVVDDRMLSDIQDVVNDSEHGLIGFNQNQDILNIIPTIAKAEQVRFESQQLHQEIFKTVVFNREHSPTGMNLNVLGIKWFETLGFKLLSAWPVMQVLNALGASKQIANKSVVLPIKQSPALLLLTTSAQSRKSIVNSGRQMQRVWLKCTEMGLSVQIYAAPGVLSLIKPNVGKNQLETLSAVESDLNNLTASLAKGRGLLFFRIGFIAGAIEKTGRRAQSSFEK
ncbi:hypothetical protein DXX93_19680 [Thalassotalea euphylliae]|uniref:Nitroreductase domain-containing protein n=1 Tax=Thalassotalea euphylliae TaxID=1655234 RepID=A0A3E0TX66_9GAMM|nr:hypothetical protein [Thalassotalea euphylliae]REL28565.1 hypothetical protein DXX93_19680 [Thalassotalea euphylliae]